MSANALATEGLVPDLTVLLTLSASERRDRLDRRGGTTDRAWRATSSTRASTRLRDLPGSAWQAMHRKAGYIVGINGAGAEEEVFSRIVGALAEKWPKLSRRLRGLIISDAMSPSEVRMRYRALVRSPRWLVPSSPAAGFCSAGSRGARPP